MPKMRWRPGLRPGPRWGSARRSPRPPRRLGRGIPPPYPLPRASILAPSALDTRRPRRLDLWLPQCKILATCLCPPLFLMAGDAPVPVAYMSANYRLL